MNAEATPVTQPDAPARPTPWLANAALLLTILGLNFFLRCYLDQAGRHLTSFLAVAYPDKLEEFYALSWWQYFLPIECMGGTWCTTCLVMVHGLEHIVGGPTNVFYLANAFLIVTSYCLSWHVFRSSVVSVTLSLCMGLGSYNHATYVIAGGVALPFLLSYLMFFLFCQFKLLQPGCNYLLWTPLGLLGMVVYAIGYEGWLDCVACMGLVYPFLIALAWRHGDYRRAKVAAIILAVTIVGAGAYVVAKTKLGHGQGQGSESDVIFNYGKSFAWLAVEDMITHLFTHFFITVSTFLPPSLFNASVSSWKYGTEPILALQHNYHPERAQFVVYHHLFLWRFYAGFAAAAFLFAWYKSIRASWTAPSVCRVGFFVFLAMTLLSGATHTLVKYRPMHSAPFLTYHSYFGIVGYSLLLGLIAWWVQTNFKRRWLAWALVVLLWFNIGYCALMRPALLSYMSVQCGCGPYPDAWQNLKNLVRGEGS